MFTPVRLTAIVGGLLFATLTGCVSQADYDQLKTHNNELSAQLTQTKGDDAVALKKLQDDLATAQKQLDLDKAQIDALNAASEKYKSGGQEALAALDKSKAKLEQSQSDLTSARATITEDDAKLKAAQTSLDDTTKALKNTQDASQTLSKNLGDKIDKLEAEKMALTQQIADLKAKIAAKGPATRP